MRRHHPHQQYKGEALLRFSVTDDEHGSFGLEIDDDGTVLAFSYPGAPAEVAGIPLGSVGARHNRMHAARFLYIVASLRNWCYLQL